MSPEILNGAFASIGAIAGSFVTFLLGRLSAWRDTKKNHVSIRFWSPVNLTRSLNNSGLQLQITQGRKRVETIFEGTAEVLNDGQAPVKGLAVLVSSSARAKIIGGSCDGRKSNLAAHFVSQRVNDATFKFLIDYLNPAEKVALYCYFSASPDRLVVDCEIVGPAVEVVNVGEMVDRLERQWRQILDNSGKLLLGMFVAIVLVVLGFVVVALTGGS